MRDLYAVFRGLSEDELDRLWADKAIGVLLEAVAFAESLEYHQGLLIARLAAAYVDLIARVCATRPNVERASQARAEKGQQRAKLAATLFPALRKRYPARRLTGKDGIYAEIMRRTGLKETRVRQLCAEPLTTTE
jgi:hypothetical protein